MSQMYNTVIYTCMHFDSGIDDGDYSSKVYIATKQFIFKDISSDQVESIIYVPIIALLTCTIHACTLVWS